MRMKRILFSLICICLFSLQSLAQNIYLVSVGIADYPGTENDLTLPAKDAETIQWIYQKNQKAETILLTDAQATRSNVLSYQDIKKTMAKSAAKNKMIFADACFSGKMREPRRNSSNISPSSLKVMLFLSSRENEVSIESPSMKNGFFTTCLQRGLRGGADINRDRIITAKELFEFVSQGIKKLSRDKQHPVMWGKFSDSMPVMIW